MTTSVNPLYYLKHAWEKTNSGWGKACIVLFYLFIWLQIIWAIELIIAPTYGWECFYDRLSDFDAYLVAMNVRTMNIIALGFFLYADRGGIKIWNVAMVFLINLGLSIPYFIAKNKVFTMDGHADKDCKDLFDGMCIALWVLVVWSAVNLLFSILDRYAAPSGTTGETTPLVV